MDAWERMFRDEQEVYHFLLREEFTSMSLNEILEQLQARIDFIAKMDDAEWPEWVTTYQAIAQVKQAIAMERIAKRLDGWNASGVPVEHIGGH